MPTFLVPIISAIGTAIGGAGGAFLIMNAAAVASGVLLAGSLALSAYQSSRAKKKAREAYNASQVDRLANVVTTVAQRELVLGRVRKGGPVIFRGSAGSLNERFIVHLALAAHEIDAVEAVYLNDQEVTLDSDGYVTTAPYYQERKVSAKAYIYNPGTSVTLPFTPVAGSVTAHVPTSDSGVSVGGWSELAITVAGNVVTLDAGASAGTVEINYQHIVGTSYARIRSDLGAGTATADSRTMELFPSLWTANHRGQGIAKLIAEFTYDETAFPSGIPVITARVRGAKVYDPRTGLTAWSDNPALLARHVYQHAYFGKATVSADEDVRFTAAANACDVSHGYTVGGVIDTEPLYVAGMVVPYGTAAASVLDDLAQSMAGMWAFAGGELYIRAGVYTASVKTLTDTDLAVVQRSGDSENQDPLSISVHRERVEKFNVVNARIWDGEQGYKMVALSPVKSTALITRDGEELAQEVAMPAVSYAPQAQHIAGVMMRDSRDPLVFEAPWKMSAYPLELFDTVSVTLARYGWTAKAFVAINRVWEHERGIVRLTLKETSAAIYTPDAAFLPQGYAENTSLPNPWDIEPPALTAAGVYSGTDELVALADGTILTRVRVAWSALTDQTIVSGGQIELQWAPVGSAEWQSVLVDGSASQAYLIGAQDGSAIVVRGRSKNSLAVSDWSAQVTHVVVGKTEPPAPVATFSIRGNTLSWSDVSDLDLAGYVVRFNYGTSSAWGTGAAMHSGLLTESPWTPQVLPSGQITLMIKAQDTSGNQSAVPAIIVADLADPLVENLILTYDDKAAGFPGDKVNCSVVSGDLVADDSGDLFWGDDRGNFWSTNSSDFWPIATYLGLEYETSYTVGSGEAGTRLTLELAVVAESYSVEYRYDSTAIFWGADTEFAWDDDGALFWEPPTPWEVWPGELAEAPLGAFDLRLTTQAGLTQGVISALAMHFDVEDEFEELDDVAISALGTRLPITKTYRSINNVQLTLQDDGGTAVSARWVDKDKTLGPLVQCINSAGTAVAGVLDARIQGVKG